MSTQLWEQDKAKESLCQIFSVNSQKKKGKHTPPQKYFSQNKNVSSPVWKENKNGVGKNKKKTQNIP